MLQKIPRAEGNTKCCRIFQEQNAIRKVAKYSRNRTKYEMLQNIPGTERNKKCCRIFQEQNAIRNIAEYSSNSTQ